MGCKYHANVDEFIISKQPPVIYAGSSNKEEFVRVFFRLFQGWSATGSVPERQNQDAELHRSSIRSDDPWYGC